MILQQAAEQRAPHWQRWQEAGLEVGSPHGTVSALHSDTSGPAALSRDPASAYKARRSAGQVEFVDQRVARGSGFEARELSRMRRKCHFCWEM
ncbi:hypothetical protein KM043_005242 [Ampulex compressa]|nr:hypothetical protein KM043_005242 [Ampulex compressa]